MKAWREGVNPFEVVQTADRPALAGGPWNMPRESVRTLICVTDRDELSGDPFLQFEGFWWPRKGDVMRLCAPNRDAVVVGVVAMLEHAGFTAYVYVRDPVLARLGPQ